MIDSNANTVKDTDVLIAYLEWDTAFPGFTRNLIYKQYPSGNTLPKIINDQTVYFGG